MRRFIVGGLSILPALSSPRAATERLLELERILAHDRRTPSGGEFSADAVAVHLTEMPAERIRRFTHALGTTPGSDVDNDAIDMLTIRLLMNDFANAVGHLRAVATIAASLVDEAATPVRETQRFLKREAWREEKRRARSRQPGGPETPAS
jgi:hypothetical protein